MAATQNHNKGEMNLDILIANMVPSLHENTYVFGYTTSVEVIAELLKINELISFFKEEESDGVKFTVICKKDVADGINNGTFLPQLKNNNKGSGETSGNGEENTNQLIVYDYVCKWITLQVHSALEAVGLTAAFAVELGEHNISANVVAGFYHDHIFVSESDGENAVKVLKGLSENKKKQL